MHLRSALLFACLTLPLAAQDTFHGREIARTMHWRGAEWLLRETRESEEGVSLLLDRLGLKPGMTVCDLGVGVGVHALPIAERVGDRGVVLGVDIQPEMLTRLEERATAAGAANVRAILGTEDDPKLEPASCDLILLVDVYHEMSKPAQMLAAMHRALKPGGRVALVEFRAEDPKVPIKPLHKMSKAQILLEWESSGFALVEQYDGLPWQHLMFFAPAGGAARAGDPAPVPPVPSARQLAWHEREYYAFVHFNMNTFTDVEWGEGRDPAERFQPSELDCRQWARVAREAGMSGIILTAKHHDGFCLWDSALTEYDVASSSWRGGRGDVLADLSAACREAGLGFGVYLSPWDRNSPLYGDSPRYNAYFKGQLKEVLTGYGEVFEVWFDGACGEGPNGKRQVYDWPGFIGVVREHQPGAVIFSDVGPDVRWVGNERGFAAETSWSTFQPEGYEPGMTIPGQTEGHPGGPVWLPPEADVSIRPGWYYHPDQDDDVKTVEQLLAIWHGSVGRNANLLLNLPVDRRGLVHEHDVEALMGLRRALDGIYAADLARGSFAHASSVHGAEPRFAASRALDGDPATYWAAAADDATPSLTVELGAERTFDRVLLREPIALGQRVESFRLEARSGGRWEPLAAGTTVGRKRILLHDPRTADALRLTVDGFRGAPLVSALELYHAPEPDAAAEED